MGDGYQVDLDRLDKHPHELEGIAAQGDQVVGAGHEVTPQFWDNAYGLLCQPFPLATRPIVEVFLGQLGKIVGGVRKTADAVGQAADSYRAAEERLAGILDRLGDQLETPSEKRP